MKLRENSRSQDKPLRRCAVSGDRHSKEDLIRFVLDADRHVVPDIANRLPGRGVWVSLDRQSLETAVRRGAFARGFKGKVELDEDLPRLVDELLARAALNALSLTNKAGQLVAGFAKVENAIRVGEIVRLVHAADAAEDGAGKLNRRFRARSGRDAGVVAPIGLFTCDELSLALGRSNVIHAGLKSGGAAGKFAVLAARLEHYRTGGNQDGAEGNMGGTANRTVEEPVRNGQNLDKV